MPHSHNVSAIQSFEDTVAAFAAESVGKIKPNSNPSQVSPDVNAIMKLCGEFPSKVSADMQTRPILASAISDALSFINSSQYG